MSARRPMNLSVLSIVAVVSLATAGCKTKVDPNAFEGGAAAAPSVETTQVAASDDAGSAGDGAVEPLAPLQTGGAAHPVAPAVAGGSHATTKPATDPPECVEARKWCAGSSHNPASTRRCEDNRSACFNKGGHL